MKKNLLFVTILALLIFGCKAKTSETEKTENPSSTNLVVNPDALVQMDVSIEGMTCTGCENTINSSVANVNGVVEINSSFETGKAVVKFDSTQADISKISQAINDKGYKVTGYAVHQEDPKAEEAAQ
ncbi:MAG: heavy-metal-associated domain-containing protein [Bacteroidales bacterium]|nr:heavy-metal-associated domain-containing protein [Bacteroidales bacterium]MCB9012853.1 heavy-metal-associated domain-containing protein [Bacteroidales bacterium]